MKVTKNITVDRLINALMLSFCLASCEQQSRPSNDGAVDRAGGKFVSAERLKKIEKVDGHRVYVPVYSYVYHMEDDVFYLTNTLSIRNTDETDDIYITAVNYYDTKGKLIRSYTEKPVQLPPLATLEYIIGVYDSSGGSGANFIVEWISDKAVTEPVIECVMIGTQSQQGISLISVGKVLD